MSAPLLWILLPLAFGMLLLFARSTRQSAAVGVVGALLLALAALALPIDAPIRLVGDFGIRISPSFSVLGRRLVLTNAARPLIAGVYLSAAVWFAGAYVARLEPTFVGLAFDLVALLLAALAVRPFLYAALIIEAAVLLSVPLLSPPGSSAGRGVLRFLTLQTLGMPFILLTGWMLVGTETSLPGTALALRSEVLLGIGFALLLGVFPFHSWAPMLGEEVHPYAAALVLLALTTVVAIFGLFFLERYAWLREAETVYRWLRLIGALMIVLNGLLAAFQRHAGRALGYGLLMDTGFGLFALGAGGKAGLALFFALLPPRVLLFALWAVALSGLGRRRDGLSYPELAGIGAEAPLLLAAAVLAPLALAGIPLFVAAPTRLAIWKLSSNLGAYWLAAILLGSAGLAAAAFRLLGVLVATEAEKPWASTETADEWIWVGGLLLAAILLGVFVGFWVHGAAKAALLFPHLR